ncbi:tetrahydrofolylpolyglutamate synthase [Grosmannia clavigera kw1407]|uniref:tetrahydrofolate synthase n=1 Tax=Grosmannia clavigera (strain kw1407 / UAMH 11150) TaxID=655863 RepID=F0X744_GROCL|nr:tetrahydrofolylpolyglutamate synthase [Grosmannia clavigera kw1407]EFX06379.1 tetrahydrofolylpolyglutamate synthase [Grosmannia clavigera kw1407]
MHGTFFGVLRRYSCRIGRPSIRNLHRISEAKATISMASTTPTYADAIRLLNSTQTGYKTLEQRRRDGFKLDDQDPIGQMNRWLGYMGYAPADLNRLNVVHVAGTKGKGTTCALTNSILERYRQGDRKGSAGPHKVGLFTSPHLVAVRERIRIDSAPISEADFARYFFEVWQALEAGDADAPRPSYFRFLTLLSLHVFVREGVDAAIYEVGVGGELDATNVFVAPAATAVSTLGIDHVVTLGHTIDRIAWHKAGIFKPGCPALTVPQQDDPIPTDVLRARAAERQSSLTILQPDCYEAVLRGVRITPDEPFQRKNAALAVALAATVLRRLGVDDGRIALEALGLTERHASSDSTDGADGTKLPQPFVDGLENVVWRGRCESKTTDRQRWYLDGAHNHQSLDVACRWFSRAVATDSTTPTILIFNQQSTRDAVDLLRVVHETVYRAGVRFQHAVFCTNVTYKDNSWKVDFVNNNVDPSELKSLSLQQTLADYWKTLDPDTDVAVAPTVEDAVDRVRAIGGGQVDTRTLITGSFHLIGGALTVLEGGEAFAHESISATFADESTFSHILPHENSMDRLYPKATQNRLRFHDPGFSTVIVAFLRAAGRNFLLLQLLFLGLFAYIFGSLFQQSAHGHNLTIAFVDYDGGSISSPIGQAVLTAYASLAGTAFPTLIERARDDFPLPATDLRHAVCRTDYWGALYVSAGASGRLQAALNSSSSRVSSNYNRSDVLFYIWNEARYPVVVDALIAGSIQTLAQAARIVLAANGTATDSDGIIPWPLGSPATVDVLANPWTPVAVDIQPTPQGSRAIYNTLVIILILIQEFFYLGIINALTTAFHTYSKIHALRILLIRTLNALSYTLIGALCTTGAIWAFRDHWDVQALQFGASWMVL